MKRITAAMAVLNVAAVALAQSSSLYLTPSQPVPIIEGQARNPFMEQASYLAVSIPEPRQFSLHDLVTIIVRESASATSESELETNKELTLSGEIAAFPYFDPGKLVGEALNQNPNPNVDLRFTNEFEGDGEYARSDETVFRITARVVDVKPNGTLALEARKEIHNDDEVMTITLTGYCRAEDVLPDNTVLSTQMFDLRVDKQHEGEIRKANKKGLFTKAIDFLLNF